MATASLGLALLCALAGAAYAAIVAANRGSARELAWTIGPAALLVLLIVVSLRGGL